MKNLARLPVWMAMWALQIAAKAVIGLLGLVMVAVVYQKRYTPLEQLPKWAILWANPEDWHGGFKNYDGSIPPWFKKKMDKRSEFWQFYKYHAIRNPADGLRNVKWLQLWIDKDKVEYWTPVFYKHYDAWWVRRDDSEFTGVIGYIAWQGAYMGLKVQWYRKESYSEIKFGFRVEPQDAVSELPEHSARRHLGASFANKVLVSREL